MRNDQLNRQHFPLVSLHLLNHSLKSTPLPTSHHKRTLWNMKHECLDESSIFDLSMNQSNENGLEFEL